ncbi:RING finger protein nhl-1 isoform X3 [Drosophila hydei]|uniref:RING finger protein nhl-1 isoform X3 n=1 Tax=Drosophila hydei TaxID=7224 RepID=A0A6J1L855_DROHY|nr:RING finger protein nhl-1 isoform X3 [Drosophila hydei]
MEQFEQLLTCCVCLDRYRIPKLLPCQHSFCMEPCMEGLVDYVRRQVKCPECRAEHRIPYNGVQAFPTNVTLQRFLELHIEITGELPDPTSGQIMERCGVCSEKAYLSHCAHCEKKICEDCKSAHMDILRREITRFNSQIRRSLHRLQDSLAIIEKNTTSLQTNAIGVTEEIDEIYRRITKAIKDRSDGLKGEIDRYLAVELRNLTTLKENLDLEITNITSNCDIVDKYMNETVEWDDCELMDTKEIFLKTVEFLRHFEYENNDYSRRVRFIVSIDPNQLVMNLATFGDLNIAPHSTPSGSVSSSHLAPPSALQPGLMRSKSDHRLATQFRQQEERGGYNDEPVLGGRKFGERPQRSANNNSDRYGDNRYGRSEYDYENDYENEPAGRAAKSSRFRSRFVRSHQNEDSDSEQQQQQRQQEIDKRKDRVLDSEDVSRGQLSGIIRLSDCSRVVQRLAEIGKEKKEKKSDVAAHAAQAAVQAAIQAQKAAMQRQQQKNQQSAAAAAATDEDELARQKRKSAAASSAAGETSSEQRPNTERVTALKRGGLGGSEESDSSSSNQAATAAAAASPSKPAVSAQVAAVKKTQRSGSSDSSASTESSASSAAAAAAAATTTTTTSTSGSSSAQPAKAASSSRYSSAREATVTATPEKKPFVSRFLPQHSNPSTSNGSADKKKAESDSSSEEETSSESESESEAESKPKTSAAASSSSSAATKSTPSSAASSTTAAGSSSYRDRLEARRASRDDTNSTTTRSSYATPNSSSSGYGSSSSPRTRPVPAAHHIAESDDRYGSGSSYTSRFLNKSKSSAIVAQPSLSTPNASFDDDGNGTGTGTGTGDDSDSRYGTGRSRYLAMKERRNRLARSRSSHQFGNEDDDLDEPVSPTTVSPSAYLASRYSGYGSSDLSRSRSSHALKSRDNSPITDRSAGSSRSALGSSADNKDGEALSSWARYLKNKYGNKSSKDAPSSSSGGSARDSHASGSTAASRSTASDVSRRLSLGLPLRQANELASSDDDGSKNGLGSPTSPTVAAAAGITGVAGTIPKQVYLRKRQQLFQLGGRGSEPGSFTWPRGLAVGPDNSIVVADSSNHRVQVFDSNGIFVKEFGEYGNGEGEFDCLAGVAVNRIGQYIIADRYNHRIQVLDPQGRFLRAFGSQGVADGKFNYPWGVTTDALGFIYVCDKENHRVQVFQSDGSFVGKFGSCGRGEGQLEHPHYIAVSNTNRVIVSDSNNHRIQIFDVNGKVLSTVGGEGSDDGQFKFPRGVAVDDQGYIFVADSGNNRIQIFNPDGSFLKTFGSWGSGDSEFKGLEGVAIMSNGNILVCDRENHRVQVF